MTKKCDASPGGEASPPVSRSPDSGSGNELADCLTDTKILRLGDVCFDIGWYPEPDRYSSAFGFRRHDSQRQLLERALRGFVDKYALPPWSLERLSDEIYKLWRSHEMQKRLAGQAERYDRNSDRWDRQYFRNKLADSDEDTLLHGAHMERYQTLRKRGLSRQRAVEGALSVSYGELSRREMQAARKRLVSTAITGRKDREPSLLVHYLERVAEVLQRETDHPIRFSSYTESRPPPTNAAGRHYGPEFDVMGAAAKIAGQALSNEALAAHIRRIRAALRKKRQETSAKPIV